MPTVGSLKIEMTRNDNGPVFSRKPYTVDLEWRDLPGTPVVTLSATDGDGVSLKQKSSVDQCSMPGLSKCQNYIFLYLCIL